MCLRAELRESGRARKTTDRTLAIRLELTPNGVIRCATRADATAPAQRRRCQRVRRMCVFYPGACACCSCTRHLNRAWCHRQRNLCRPTHLSQALPTSPLFCFDMAARAAPPARNVLHALAAAAVSGAAVAPALASLAPLPFRGSGGGGIGGTASDPRPSLASLGAEGALLAALLQRPGRDGGRPRIVALTGAGVSTASGIPDYRSPGRPAYVPLTHAQFVGQEATRRRCVRVCGRGGCGGWGWGWRWLHGRRRFT